jgi:hypothetical protein
MRPRTDDGEEEVVQRASRYQRRLAKAQGAASVDQALAQRRAGEEREILLAPAPRGEERHAAHWATKLHPSERRPHPPKLRARAGLARQPRLGPLVQRAEAAGADDGDPEATAAWDTSGAGGDEGGGQEDHPDRTEQGRDGQHPGQPVLAAPHGHAVHPRDQQDDREQG